MKRVGCDRTRPGRFSQVCQVWTVCCLLLLAACTPGPATHGSATHGPAALTPTAPPTATDIPSAGGPPADTPTDTSRPLPSRPERNALPASEAIEGWVMEGAAGHYDSETLFDFMNGAADLYFTYGFEGLHVGQYVDRDGRVIQVEIYDTATDADAYGLFTYNSYGEPIDLGVDGELDSGYRLAFWQGDSFVQIAPREEVQNAILRAFGEAVAAALPGGGQRPSLVDALPQEGLAPGSVRFFREKMALDNLLWLGPNDVMGLGVDTQGVVAHYDLDGGASGSGGAGVDLLLVSFPDADRAEQARLGLEGAELDRVALETKDDVLGAVIGQADAEAGRALLAAAFAALP